MVFPCPTDAYEECMQMHVLFYSFFLHFCVSFFSIDSFLQKLKLVLSGSVRLMKEIILERRKIQDFTCSRKTNLKLFYNYVGLINKINLQHF